MYQPGGKYVELYSRNRKTVSTRLILPKRDYVPLQMEEFRSAHLPILLRARPRNVSQKPTSGRESSFTQRFLEILPNPRKPFTNHVQTKLKKGNFIINISYWKFDSEYIEYSNFE